MSDQGHGKNIRFVKTTDINNLRVDTNTLSSISGNINITPVAGSNIQLDTDTIIDGGVIVNTGSFQNDNLKLDGNTLSSTDTNGDINITPDGTGSVVINILTIDNIKIDGNTISSTDTNGNIILAPDGTGSVVIDNLQLNGNTLSATDTDGDIILTPDGTGGIGNVSSLTNYLFRLAQPEGSAAIDQQQVAENATAGDPTQWQSFTAGLSGYLSAIDAKNGSGLGATNCTVTIREGTGASGTILAQETGLTFADGSIETKTVTAQPFLQSGSVYTIQIGGTNWGWRKNIAGGYGGGTFVSGGDAVFRTRMISAAEFVVRNDNFRVGIGTENPTVPFEVVGDTIITGSVDITGDLDIDNLNINGNTISSTDTNGEIYILPDGTGSVRIGDGNVTNNRGMVIIDGAAGSVEGPHLSAFVSGDNDYPVFFQMNWSHDNISLLFDAYYDGSWRSSDVGSNFKITKDADLLRMSYNSGSTPGDAFIWDDAWRLNVSGEITEPKQPRFLAYRSSTLTNVIGGGVYTIICDTEVEDIGGNYNNTTGIYTCSVAGRFTFMGAVRMDDIGATNTSGVLRIETSNSIYYGHLENINAVAASGGALVRTMSIDVPMDAADTAKLSVDVVGSTVIDLISASNNTYFGGSLKC